MKRTRKASLAAYRGKRRFRDTPEPSGDKAPSSAKPLHFVVQRHDASHLHYDFRIELDGVLRSWAVPKGPSMDPSVQRLAVEVENHPLDYAKFEGTIPAGNYGAGEVKIWDKGTYRERTSRSPEEGLKTLRKGLERGHITLWLEGEKLRGEFALIRLPDRGRKVKKPNWLLIKKRDAYATHADILRESPEGTASTSDFPRGWRPQLPLPGLRLPATGEWVVTPFRNGLRLLAEIERGQVLLRSKTGLDLTAKHPKLAAALTKAAGRKSWILDGEFAEDEGRHGTYHIWDLPYDGDDLRELALAERLKKLARLRFGAAAAPVKKLTGASGAKGGESSLQIETSVPTADFEKSSATGGLLVREVSSPYRPGLSRDWLKLKGTASLERDPKKAARAKGRATSPGPVLTNLDKIYWPREDYTKGDLIEYYRSVSEWLLPHLVERPESLSRYPDGIRGKSFYQKDVTGYLPSWIETFRIYSESAAKTVQYLVCQNLETLLYMANLGCIEMHPWLSRRAHHNHPDYAIIDLDPDDGNSFREVMEVAKEFQGLLQELRAPAYVKTSGATGIHIAVPTGAKFDFDQVRIFSERLCEVVHERVGKGTSLERSPAKRRGLIYLDYLQNRRGQTLASAYSVRPRPGAPVSTPLEWAELKGNLTPERFHIENTVARLKRKGDLWKGLLTEKPFDIEVGMRKLAKL